MPQELLGPSTMSLPSTLVELAIFDLPQIAIFLSQNVLTIKHTDRASHHYFTIKLINFNNS